VAEEAPAVVATPGTLFGVLTNYFYDAHASTYVSGEDGMLWDFQAWAPLAFQKPHEMQAGWTQADFGIDPVPTWGPAHGEAVPRNIFARVQSGRSAANPEKHAPEYRNIICWLEAVPTGHRFRLTPPYGNSFSECCP
jgi:hypothetical protein